MQLSKISTTIKNHFRKVISIKKSPHSIALGFSIGTLLALLPTFGFAPFIGVILVILFTKLNKFSLFGAFIIWNPIVLIPFYYLSFKLGNLLLGSTPIVRFEFTILNAIHLLTLRFLLGNLIVSVTISIISYFIIKILAEKFQRRKQIS